MKSLITIAVLLVVFFLIIQINSMSAQKGIESYPYELIKSYTNFEVRAYEVSLFTSIKLPTGEYEQASSNGFSILAGYIFGGNDKQEKIAMTSPVTMSLEDSMTMMFMVPKELDKDKLPVPNQKEIEFVEVPPKKMAAIRFGGWASTEKIKKYKAMLIAELEKEGITHNNKFYYFGYNPPYEVVNRRNEVLVEVEGGIK